MSLKIEAKAIALVGDHARETYPRECCGIFLGRGDASAYDWTVIEVMRANNLAPESSRDRYRMDPLSRLAAERRASAAGLSVVGFYHSHPDHDVYFSKTDLENSEEFLLGEPWTPPAYAYFVVSIRDGVPDGFGAFVVKDGASARLDVVV